jgi:hypothetical protein
MTFVDLVHPDVTHRIPVDLLVAKCRLFTANQELTRAPYRVRSAVSADSFRVFVAALEGKAVDMTEMNCANLSQLCEEFGFGGLTAALRDSKVRRRISVLEERWQQSERTIAELQSTLSRLTKTQELAMTALEAEVAQLKEAVGGLAAQATRVDRSDADIARVASEAAELRAAVKALKSWIAPKVDSLIIAEFPLLFEEFGRKCFKLLWRGSRDGFTAKEFHLRCDGRANTLTLIADTDGNVFGGFTPVK